MNRNILLYILILQLPLTFLSQAEWVAKINTPNLYDENFLNYWNHIKPFELLITNDSIIINNEINSPILIPTDLPLNKEVKYECRKADTIFMLILKRINFTNIDFSINGYVNNVLFFERNGESMLEPTFYLGSEGLYNKSEDEIYGMNDYIIKSDKNEETKFLIPEGTNERVNYIENKNKKEISIVFNKSK